MCHRQCQAGRHKLLAFNINAILDSHFVWQAKAILVSFMRFFFLCSHSFSLEHTFHPGWPCSHGYWHRQHALRPARAAGDREGGRQTGGFPAQTHCWDCPSCARLHKQDSELQQVPRSRGSPKPPGTAQPPRTDPCCALLQVPSPSVLQPHQGIHCGCCVAKLRY